MNPRAWQALPVAALLSLSGCARLTSTPASVASPCAPPAQALQRDTLYFGRRLADGRVLDDARWRRFVEHAIAPAFPAGFTVLDAAGQWRDARGAVVAEPSKVLIVLHPGRAADTAAVRGIAEKYKRQFAQDAVLRETALVCAEF